MSNALWHLYSCLTYGANKIVTKTSTTIDHTGHVLPDSFDLDLGIVEPGGNVNLHVKKISEKIWEGNDPEKERYFIKLLHSSVGLDDGLWLLTGAVTRWKSGSNEEPEDTESITGITSDPGNPEEG